MARQDYDIRFNKSRPFSLGCEIEFQLLNPATQELKSASVEILNDLPPEYQGKIKQEFIQSMLEVCTGVCTDISELEKDLRQTILVLQNLADRHGCSIFASSLHPFSAFSKQLLFPDPRYARIMNELGIVGRRLITQGLHCHVGLENQDQAIYVFDNLRPWLPLFLAISASSPFFEGVNTGLVSYRSNLFDALPRSGMPEKLGSWQSYCNLLSLMKQCGIIESPRDIWWDIRPSPDFGTIEVRICDVPTKFEHMAALVSLIQASVAAIATGRLDSPDTHIAVILSNKWQAARHGLNGTFVNHAAVSRKLISEILMELMKDLEPVFQELGSQDYLPVLHRMVHEGPGSKRICSLIRQTGDMKKTILQMQQEFWTAGSREL